MPLGRPPRRRPAPGGAPARAGAGGELAAVGNIVKAIVALLGLLPSVALLTGLIEIPASLERLVKLVTVPLGIVAIAAIMLQAPAIRRWSAGRAIAVFGACVIAGAAAAATYYVIAERCAFEYRGERMVSPLDPSAEIRDIILAWGNRYDQALEYSPRSDRLQELLRSERVPTLIAMFLLMVVSQLLSVIAIVGSALKLVAQPGGAGAR